MLKKSLVSLSTLLGLTSVGYLSVIAPAQAQITNGGFETGDFTGWERIETLTGAPLGSLTSVQTAAYGTNPKSGTYQGLMNFDLDNSAFSDELDEFLELSNGTFDDLGATGGSAIKQTINVTTPSILSFSYNFLTDEPDTGFNDDFGFFTINLNNNVEEIVSVSGDNFSASGTPFAQETGYQDYTSGTLGVGTYTLGFGAANLIDFEGASGILIDEVTLTPDGGRTTPEPSAMLASLLVLSGGALVGKKKKQGSNSPQNLSIDLKCRVGNAYLTPLMRVVVEYRI